MSQLAIFNVVVSFLFGTLLGSFFNVLIYRLPKGESIVFPGSHCPACGKQIRWYDNIPVISYLLLCGKCRECKVTISIIYPAIELLTGFLGIVVWFFIVSPFLEENHLWWEYGVLIVKCACLLVLIPVTFIDIKHLIIPDSISLGGLVLGFAASFIPGFNTPIDSLWGILAGGGSLYAVGILGSLLFKKEAMGGGDVKLMAFFGSIWGWKLSLLSIFAGSFFGALAGIPLLLKAGAGRNTKIPFGPYLAVGIWVSVLWGDRLLRWYANFISQ